MGDEAGCIGFFFFLLFRTGVQVGLSSMTMVLSNDPFVRDSHVDRFLLDDLLILNSLHGFTVSFWIWNSKFQKSLRDFFKRLRPSPE